MGPSSKRKGFGPFGHLISLSVMESHFQNRLTLHIQQTLQYVKLRISIRSSPKIEDSYKRIWESSNEKFQGDSFGGKGGDDLFVRPLDRHTTGSTEPHKDHRQRPAQRAGPCPRTVSFLRDTQGARFWITGPTLETS